MYCIYQESCFRYTILSTEVYALSLYLLWVPLMFAGITFCNHFVLYHTNSTSWIHVNCASTNALHSLNPFRKYYVNEHAFISQKVTLRPSIHWTGQVVWYPNCCTVLLLDLICDLSYMYVFFIVELSLRESFVPRLHWEKLELKCMTLFPPVPW